MPHLPNSIDLNLMDRAKDDKLVVVKVKLAHHVCHHWDLPFALEVEVGEHSLRLVDVPDCLDCATLKTCQRESSRTGAVELTP